MNPFGGESLKCFKIDVIVWKLSLKKTYKLFFYFCFKIDVIVWKYESGRCGGFYVDLALK